MNHERNALKAGIFIIASAVLVVAIIIGIKGIGRFLEPMQDAEVTFKLTDDIGGLSAGDEVRVGGAKVGAVRDVQVVDDPSSAGRKMIEIAFTLPRKFKIHRDAVVSVQSTVTGVSVLNFSDFGSGPVLASGQALVGNPAPLNAFLQTGPEILAMVKDFRTVTVPKVNNAIDRTSETVAEYRTTGQNATELIQSLRAQVTPMVDRYNSIVDTAKGALQNIRDLFGDTKSDFRTTMANLRDATGAIKDKLPGVLDKTDGLLTKVTTAVESTNVALEDVQKIVANTRDVSASARQIVTGNRGKIDNMITALKTTGDNLKNASAEIRRSPWRLLYKPGPGEMANLNLYDSARQFADGANQLNDAATALRDALKDPDVKQTDVQKLVDKLDASFANFNKIENDLWDQVKE